MHILSQKTYRPNHSTSLCRRTSTFPRPQQTAAPSWQQHQCTRIASIETWSSLVSNDSKATAPPSETEPSLLCGDRSNAGKPLAAGSPALRQDHTRKARHPLANSKSAIGFGRTMPEILFPVRWLLLVSSLHSPKRISQIDTGEKARWRWHRRLTSRYQH